MGPKHGEQKGYKWSHWKPEYGEAAFAIPAGNWKEDLRMSELWRWGPYRTRRVW